MNKLILLGLLLSLFTPNYAQSKYTCFENDKNKKLRLQVSFDKNENPKYVKYEGQKDSILLIYSTRSVFKNPGGHPAEYWQKTYLEKYQGKITGEYSFTNAGTYQLDITYTRKKDKKEYYFQIIESSFHEENGIYNSMPCF
jgi:hypothetical protein